MTFVAEIKQFDRWTEDDVEIKIGYFENFSDENPHFHPFLTSQNEMNEEESKILSKLDLNYHAANIKGS